MADENPMIRAVRFHEEIRRGSSLPLLLGGDDGNQYVVKLNGAGDGVLANAVEWVSSRLGELLQIPVLRPVFIDIDADLARQAGDPETRELLERSAGVNLGTPLLPGAATYEAHHAPRIPDGLKQQIFLFDLFLLNVDRTTANPNMIVHNGELWCFDYSSAMEIRNVFNAAQNREHVLLKHLKRHPFYHGDLAVHGFISHLRALPDDGMRALVDGLPPEWLGSLKLANREAEARNVIAERLLRKKQQGTALGARLDLLRILQAETEEEINARSLANRKAFEQKYGSL